MKEVITLTQMLSIMIPAFIGTEIVKMQSFTGRFLCSSGSSGASRHTYRVLEIHLPENVYILSREVVNIQFSTDIVASRQEVA